MKSLTICLLLVAIFVVARANGTRFALKSHPPTSQRSAGTTDLYEQGRRVFGNRCGKCHDEDAAKKLPDGTTLVQRLAESKDPEALAGTRLKRMNEEDRQAVREYLNELIRRYGSSNPSNSQPKISRPTWSPIKGE